MARSMFQSAVFTAFPVRAKSCVSRLGDDVRFSHRAMLLAFSAPFLVSCNQPALPTSPSPASPAAVLAPSTSVPAAATLVVSSFSVSPTDVFNHVYWYRPELVLTETSGNSAAKLETVSFSMPNGSTLDINNNAPPGMGCFLSSESQVVPRGGSWDVNRLYYYCLDLDSPSDLPGRQVGGTVTFRDDDGRGGVVTG